MNKIVLIVLIATLIAVPAFAEPIVKTSLISSLSSAQNLGENADISDTKNENSAALNLKLAEKIDLTKYGFDLFKSSNSNTESFIIRSGLSKLSSQAAASVELIVKW